MQWRTNSNGISYATIGSLIEMRVIPDRDGWYAWEVSGIGGSIAHGRGRSADLMRERCETTAAEAIRKAAAATAAVLSLDP